jgi:NH3-dependent NAD+ synthetase
VDRKTYDAGMIAVIFGVSKQHVYKMIRNGEIPSISLSRRLVVPAWWVEAQLKGPMDASRESN